MPRWPHTGMPAEVMARTFFRLADAAFEFHGISSGCHEPAGGFERLPRGAVGVDGEIGDDEGLGFRPCDGLQMVEDVVEGDVRGVGKTEDDHAQRVADEEDIDPRFIEQAGHRIVVAGERGEGRGTFPAGDGGGFFLGCHGMVRLGNGKASGELGSGRRLICHENGDP